MQIFYEFFNELAVAHQVLLQLLPLIGFQLLLRAARMALLKEQLKPKTKSFS